MSAGPKQRLKTALISRAGGSVLDLLLATTRFEIRGKEHYDQTWGRGEPVVFVLWHGRLLPCTYYQRGQGLATLISQHRDGEYIARIAQRWGYTTIRGSSSRGGTAALRELVRVLRGGQAIAVTPDGPRGPRQQIKPGALLAAQLAGVPVVPVAAGADRAWWVGSWDRFLVPKPFTRIRIEIGAPMSIARDAGEHEMAAFGSRVEAVLNDLTRKVDGDAGPDRA
jgi:lysophospholipid acyltransferase (LPLAT)-like uncharacterized protein